MGNVDFTKMKWVHRPHLYICDSYRLTIETQPYTYCHEAKENQRGAEIQTALKGNFIFTLCTEFVYDKPFDQCGFILYNGDVQKAIVCTEKKDEEYLRLGVNVFCQDGGDMSMRDVGAALGRIFYRVIYRAGACLIQYSFAGTRYTDLREFHVNETGITAVSLFACSPNDSVFDCTFCEANISEDGKIEAEKENER
ncbi:MAG: DUF1349 domain-containing protein [Erysipelotrichaceae bacterium]|jgi:regulation of enolase protein 1 (concanavalin A-like superfamily)|nr:DUF1349 domain-containing protein [Erysipelotrichaceae bacterium]